MRSVPVRSRCIAIARDASPGSRASSALTIAPCSLTISSRSRDRLPVHAPRAPVTSRRPERTNVRRVLSKVEAIRPWSARSYDLNFSSSFCPDAATIDSSVLRSEAMNSAEPCSAAYAAAGISIKRRSSKTSRIFWTVFPWTRTPRLRSTVTRPVSASLSTASRIGVREMPSSAESR